MRITKSGIQVPGTSMPKTEGFLAPEDLTNRDEKFWMFSGPPGEPLAQHAIALAQELWGDGRYWAEHDYLEDLIMLQKLNDRARTDDAIWREYVEWERRFLELSMFDGLIFDRACAGFSPFQKYEAHDLMQRRFNQQLRTIVCVFPDDMAQTSASYRGLLSNHFTTIKIDDNGDWPVNGAR